MAFAISICKEYQKCNVDDGNFRVLTCYTPTPESFGGYPVSSLVKHPSLAKCLVTNTQALASLPGGAIIDMIEYEGVKSFAAKGEFTIGIGELNNAIMIPLIENGTSMIANSNGGGCRQFLSDSETGENVGKVKIPYNSCVNFSCSGGIQTGSLRVDIYYHVKK
jgi:hypothetical protein